jgi:PEP-CTERM motif
MEGTMRLTRKFSRSLACAALGAVGLLLAPMSGPARALVVIAEPLFINVDESITWATPSPYPGATLTASSEFEFGTTINDVFEPSGSFGSRTYSITYPPNPAFPPSPVEILLPAVQINWGDSIEWALEGSLLAPIATFPASACGVGVAFPPNPCSEFPVALNLVGGFAPINVSGGIFAFDSPVQLGTWDIKITQVPEPTSWMLLGVGFASLAAFRRRRPVVGV